VALILVLDDVREAAIVIQKILQKRAHTVHVFTDEEEAISFTRDNTVDLAILDIKLRKMEGIEVLAEMKKYQPSMQVIMLTGHPTIAAKQQSLQLGAAAFCAKPIDKTELETVVADLLGKADHKA